MEPRLTSKFWIDAYRTYLANSGIPAFITARGDPDAGAILVKLNTLDGAADVFCRSYDPDGARIWVSLARGPEAEVDATITRQRGFDPDIWVIEIEDREGRTLLDLPGLAG